MSDNTSTTLGYGELDGKTVEVRRYRLGFRHAVALSAAVVLVLLVASALTALVLGTRTASFSHDETAAIAQLDQRPLARPFTEEWLEQPADTRAGDRARDYGNQFLRAVERAIREAPRILNESGVTHAFAALNQSDPRQVREFLAAYGDNPTAKELGYVAAVRRAAAERRLYRSGEIDACGECWCWRERPVLANDATPTQ
jgi:hypothetical protein